MNKCCLRPADKFLGSTFYRQYLHVQSEIKEVDEAYRIFSWRGANEDKNSLIEELIDLQMSCETLITILGLDEQQRREARRKVIEKNEARGYYRKGEE